MNHYILGAFRVSVEKNATGNSGGFEPMTTSADKLISRAPSLPDDNRLAMILYRIFSSQNKQLNLCFEIY